MLHIPSASGLPFLGKELKVTVFLKKMAWLISNLPLASSPLCFISSKSAGGKPSSPTQQPASGLEEGGMFLNILCKLGWKPYLPTRSSPPALRLSDTFVAWRPRGSCEGPAEVWGVVLAP